MTTLDFWFDPGCPWTWATSRWVVNVHAATDLEVHWHPLSLALLFATDEPPMAEVNAISMGPTRVCAAIYTAEPEKLGDFYTELGSRIHHGNDWFERSRELSFSEFVGGYPEHADLLRSKVVEALGAAGLDAGLTAAMDDSSFDEVLAASHESVPAGERELNLGGSPVLSIDGGPGFFGPVISEVPEGFAAVELWQAFETLAQNPDFFEVKRMSDRPVPLAGIQVGRNLL